MLKYCKNCRYIEECDAEGDAERRECIDGALEDIKDDVEEINGRLNDLLKGDVIPQDVYDLFGKQLNAIGKYFKGTVFVSPCVEEAVS